MKKSSCTVLKYSLIMGLSFASAIAVGKSARVRIGIIDMQKIILSVEEGKTAREKLGKEIKSKEQEFRKKKEELDAMNKSWKKEAAMLSEQARIRKQQEFQKKFMALRNSEMEFQGSIKKKEAEVTQKIAIKVAGIVDTIAKKQDIDTVFERNSSGLLYVKDPLDLTDQVISSYEKAGGKKKVGKTENSSKPKNG